MTEFDKSCGNGFVTNIKGRGGWWVDSIGGQCNTGADLGMNGGGGGGPVDSGECPEGYGGANITAGQFVGKIEPFCSNGQRRQYIGEAWGSGSGPTTAFTCPPNQVISGVRGRVEQGFVQKVDFTCNDSFARMQQEVARKQAEAVAAKQAAEAAAAAQRAAEAERVRQAQIEAERAARAEAERRAAEAAAASARDAAAKAKAEADAKAAAEREAAAKAQASAELKALNERIAALEAAAKAQADREAKAKADAEAAVARIKAEQEAAAAAAAAKLAAEKAAAEQDAAKKLALERAAVAAKAAAEKAEVDRLAAQKAAEEAEKAAIKARAEAQKKMVTNTRQCLMTLRQCVATARDDASAPSPSSASEGAGVYMGLAPAASGKSGYMYEGAPYESRPLGSNRILMILLALLILVFAFLATR